MLQIFTVNIAGIIPLFVVILDSGWCSC